MFKYVRKTLMNGLTTLPSPRLVQSTSWLVRELSSPLVDQSSRCPFSELVVSELAYPRVIQLLSLYVHV